MSKKTRTEQRAAEVHLFTQLVEVCMEHRAVRCTHALCNQAMAALFNTGPRYQVGGEGYGWPTLQ